MSFCALFGLKLSFLLQASCLTVSGSASRLQRKHHRLPSTGKRSFPGETWNMPPAARTEPSGPVCSSSGAGRPGQLFFSYGANFSPSGHLGTSTREDFLSQLALKLVNLLPRHPGCSDYKGAPLYLASAPPTVLLLGEDKPQENPHLQGGEMSPASQSVPTTQLMTMRPRGVWWGVAVGGEGVGPLTMAQASYSCCV